MEKPEVLSEENFDPTLKDRSYEPDIFSHSNRWQNKPFRDPKTGALMIWTSPYLMPHGEGWRALGVYKTDYHQWEQDRTDYDSVHTYHHEQGHAKGYTDENLTEQYAESQSNGYYSLGA